MNLKTLTKGSRMMLTKHSPEILTGTAIVGVVTTAIFAARGALKAEKLLADATEERFKAYNDTDMTLQEEVIAMAPAYIPAALCATSTVLCVIGINSVHKRRYAALAAIWSLSERTLATFQEKAVEMVGKGKTDKIKRAVTEELGKKAPPDGSDKILTTGRGASLCYDTLSGRYFYSDVEVLRRAENAVVKELYGSMYAYLNDFYYEVGLPRIDLGDHCGWDVDEPPELRFEAILTDDGRPCIAVGYSVIPFGVSNKLA
jgi:hypothetical protein